MTRVQFGIENNASIGSTTGGGGAGKASINAFEVELLPNSGAADLARTLHLGGDFSLAFTVPDPSGGPSLPLISSSFAIASAVHIVSPRNPNQQTVVRATFALGDATLQWGNHEVSWDQVTNTGSCVSTACGCSGSQSLTYIAGNGQNFPIAPGEYLVDQFQHGVEIPVAIGSTSGGAGAGKANSQGLEIESPIDDSLLCNFRNAGFGTQYDQIVVNNAAITSGPSAYDYTLQVNCLGLTAEVEIFSNANGDLKTRTRYVVGSITETYRDIDPATGAETGSNFHDWSYVLNTSSTSCL